MKKITIATLTALMLGATQAAYIVKVPLEQAQGGSLPSGSIQFGASSEVLPPDIGTKPQKECIYQELDASWIEAPGNIYWYDTPYYIEIVWNGVVSDVDNSRTKTYFIAHDSTDNTTYKYTRGEQKKQNFTSYQYALCREPL